MIAQGRADPELAALGDRLDRAWATQRAMRTDPAWDQASDASVREAGAIAERMAGLEPQSLAGVLAQARAWAWCMEGAEEEDEGATTEQRLAIAALRGLLRVAAA